MSLLSDRDGKIWFDGELVEWRSAKVHVLSHTLHYGCGAFEGVRAYESADGKASIFRLSEHSKRLINSCKILRIPLTYSLEQLNQAQCDVVKANAFKSCYIRPLVWLGSERLGLNPKGLSTHVMVAAWEWGTYLGKEALEKGIRVKTSSFTRHHVNVTMCNAKAISNYQNSILASLEASDDGYDEALLLDPAGFVAEGPGENLFIVRDGVVFTPELGSGALNGITRQTVLQLIADLGLKCIERRVTRDEVYIADEAFFSGTAAEITPIRELDNRVIGEGKRGKICTQVQQAYFDIVYGREKKYAHWRTVV